MSYWTPVDVGDPRIVEGFGRLRARRDAELGDGATHVGWKVGMNDLGIREMLGIGSGVVGYLTDRTQSDGDVSTGLGRLGAEVEVAFVMGDDGRIVAARPAIEIVDLRELDIVEALSLDVWHHAFTLGPSMPWTPGVVDQLRVELAHNGVGIDVAPPGDDKLADLDGMLAFLQSGIAAIGDELRPGDIVLSGSLAPSILWLSPGDEVQATITPLGSTAVRVLEKGRHLPERDATLLDQ